MRTFDNFPKETTCPLCGTNTNVECTLIPIDGTSRDNICEAQPVHVACLTRMERYKLNKEEGIIYATCVGM